MRVVLLIFLFFHVNLGHSQEIEPEITTTIEDQLEDIAEASDSESEDDSYLQQLVFFKRHPLNINIITADQLRDFKMLSELQVQNFLSYRNLLGVFISIYELQAIPSWDLFSIRKLIPYITISDSKTIYQNLRHRLFGGENNLLLRFSMIIPKSKGFTREDSASNYYTGSRPQLMLRYKYNYKNLLQYGFLGDKDAGEQLFRGAQPHGFDFYSLHFFARKLGAIKALAIGDFTVNFGQGLIHWQSLSFKKSASVSSVKRQTEVLRPYSSSGEYNFHRGAGITLEKKNWEATAFISLRKLSATIKMDSPQDREGYVSSLLNSGYHRTMKELEDRNNLRVLTIGSGIKYSQLKWHVGINWVQHQFSKPFRSSGKPYDLFAIDGKSASGLSIDYGYTFRNAHFFGELASDRNFNKALIAGMIISLDRAVDVAALFRKIDKKYQSLFGNAFTENNLPSNETGIYSGISIRPAPGWRIDTYADIYKFPWLLFRADAPSYGADYLLQITYNPNKQAGISVRYNKQAKQANENSDLQTSPVVNLVQRSLRYQLSYKISPGISFTNRLELSWHDDELKKRQNGFLIYADLRYKPVSKSYTGIARLQYFDTDGYDSRVYAYENDVLFAYSTPGFFEKGLRWYIIIKTDVSKWKMLKHPFKTEIWVKYALTHYFELDKIGTELDEIQGKNRSELKFQVILSR